MMTSRQALEVLARHRGGRVVLTTMTAGIWPQLSDTPLGEGDEKATSTQPGRDETEEMCWCEKSCLTRSPRTLYNTPTKSGIQSSLQTKPAAAPGGRRNAARVRRTWDAP
jgi:hypothetical protein